MPYEDLFRAGNNMGKEFLPDYSLMPLQFGENIPPAIYQIAADLYRILQSFQNNWRYLVQTRYSSIYPATPPLLEECPPLYRLSSAQIISFIEKTIGNFVSLAAVMVQGASQAELIQNEELKNKLIGDFACFSMEFNTATEIIFRKYGLGLLRKITTSRLEDNIFFASNDDWPWEEDISELTGNNESSIDFLHKLALIFYAESPKPITITFRDEGRGRGALFDHYNIQTIVQRETTASLAPEFNPEDFLRFLDERDAAVLPYGRVQTPRGRNCPSISSFENNLNTSLIIIPGYSKTTIQKRPQVHAMRSKYEQTLIRYARYSGIPVLAICGGLATLVETFHGSIADLDNVKKHKHTSIMPKLLPDGSLADVKLPHGIAIHPQSKLAWHMGYNNERSAPRVEVTSVHWFTINKLPIGFFPAALAVHKNQNNEIIRDNEVAEAIEAPETHSKKGNGVSIIATQYHPEAARTNLPGHANAARHHGLFKSMLVEGDARNKHRIIVEEIKNNNLSIRQLYTDKLGVPEEHVNALEYPNL